MIILALILSAKAIEYNMHSGRSILPLEESAGSFTVNVPEIYFVFFAVG